MAFHEMYFPKTNEEVEVDPLLKVPDILNTYTLHSNFDAILIQKEMKFRYPMIHLNLSSGSNKLSLKGEGNSEDQKFIIAFEGEGIHFKILYQKNQDNPRGFISLEFISGASNGIKTPIEKCVISCLKEKSKDQEFILPTSSQTNTPESFCHCFNAPRFASNGMGIVRSDYTSDALTLIQATLSNGSEVDAFICNHCQGAFLIGTDYTDRPPYTSSILNLTPNDVEKVKSIDIGKLEKQEKKLGYLYRYLKIFSDGCTRFKEISTDKNSIKDN